MDVTGVKSIIAANQGTIIPAAIGAGGALVLGGVAIAAIKRSNRKKSKRRKVRMHKRSRTKGTRSKRSGRRTPHTAGKRRDTSRKRIRYTSKGQPYVILASGKARFIKKRGARASHKRPGGRY